VTPAIATALGQCLQGEPRGSDLHVACIRTVGKLGTAVSMHAAILGDLLESADANVRGEAARALFRVDLVRLEDALPAIGRRDPELEREIRTRIRLNDL
jgi:hypothetical protein